VNNVPSFVEKYSRRGVEIDAAREAILAVAQPLREQYEILRREHDTAITNLAAQVRDAEKGLADLDAERNMIARALSSNDVTMGV
jgi:hypothetical protein